MNNQALKLAGKHSSKLEGTHIARKRSFLQDFNPGHVNMKPLSDTNCWKHVYELITLESMEDLQGTSSM